MIIRKYKCLQNDFSCLSFKVEKWVEEEQPKTNQTFLAGRKAIARKRIVLETSSLRNFRASKFILKSLQSKLSKLCTSRDSTADRHFLRLRRIPELTNYASIIRRTQLTACVRIICISNSKKFERIVVDQTERERHLLKRSWAFNDEMEFAFCLPVRPFLSSADIDLS